MFLHFLSTATIIKNVHATVQGQYDYYAAEATFMNSDNTEANILLKHTNSKPFSFYNWKKRKVFWYHIPLHNNNFMSIDHFQKDNVIELEGSIIANTDNILKVSFLHFLITKHTYTQSSHYTNYYRYPKTYLVTV